MKKVFLFFALLFPIAGCLQGQNLNPNREWEKDEYHDEMGRLFEYAINHYYEDLLKYEDISDTDSVYMFGNFDKGKELFEYYNIIIDNDKIILGRPDLDEKFIGSTIHSISTPQLIGEHIVISFAPLGVGKEVIDGKEVTTLEFGGGANYYFKLNRSKNRFEFHKRKDWGI